MTQSTRAIIGALALIALGFSLGVVADRMWISPAHDAVAETPDEIRDRLLADMRQTVGLSDAQMTDVHAIFDRYQVTVSRVWENLHPHLQAALDSAFAQIHDVLDERQAELFHEWFARTHPGRHVVP